MTQRWEPPEIKHKPAEEQGGHRIRRSQREDRGCGKNEPAFEAGHINIYLQVKAIAAGCGERKPGGGGLSSQPSPQTQFLKGWGGMCKVPRFPGPSPKNLFPTQGEIKPSITNQMIVRGGRLARKIENFS